MKNRYIPAFVMLTAGLVCCLFSIFRRWDVTYSLVTLLIVLVIFYCIGTIAARIIGKMQAENLAQRKAAEEAERQRALEEEALKQKEAEEKSQDIEEDVL